MVMCSVVCMAQASGQGNRHHRQFDPQKFEQRLENHVLKTAGITQAEQAQFLTVFREKRKKEVEVITADRVQRKGRPTTEKEWENALKAHDNKELELKKIQQTYHNKMLKVIPASKVMKVIKAEEEFHRMTLREFEHNRGNAQPDRRGGNQRKH